MDPILEQNLLLWQQHERHAELLRNCSTRLLDQVYSNTSHDLTEANWLNIINNNNNHSIASSVCDLAALNQMLALKFDTNDTSFAEDMSMNQSNSTQFENWIKMDNPHEMLNPSNANPLFRVIMISHILTFLIGVLGNSVVIGTWLKHSKFRSPTNIFMVSLAVSDLFLLFICVPLKTAEYFLMDWNGLSWSCKTVAYVETMSAMSTVLNLVAVSIERFLVIVYPMRARSWVTLGSTCKGLVFIWALAFLLAIPMPFSKRTDTITYYNETSTVTLFYCLSTEDDMAFRLTIYQLIVMFIVPAILLVGSYLVVIRQLQASTRSIEGMTSLKAKSYKSKKSRRRSDSLHSNNGTLKKKDDNTKATAKKSKWRGCLWRRADNNTDRSNYMDRGDDNDERVSLNRSARHASEANEKQSSIWQRVTCCCCDVSAEGCECGGNAKSNSKHAAGNEMRRDDISLCTMSTTYQVTTLDANSGVRFIQHDPDQSVVQVGNGEPKEDEHTATSLPLLASPSISVQSNSSIFTILKNNPRPSANQQPASLASATNPHNDSPALPSTYTRVHEMYSRNVANNVIEIIRTRTKVMHMIVLIMALFLFFWGPRLIMDVCQKYRLLPYSNLTYNARIVFNLLSFVHSALNPFVYGLMSSNFRAMACSMFCNARATRRNRARLLAGQQLKPTTTMEMTQVIH